jgi:hypothetical protein
MNSHPWRVMYSKAEVGAWNMALDEAILEAAGRKDSPPQSACMPGNLPACRLVIRSPQRMWTLMLLTAMVGTWCAGRPVDEQSCTPMN